MAKRLVDADALVDKMRFDVCTDCLGSIMIDDGTHYNVVCWMEKPLAPEGLRCTDTENG